jgi:hypothetical protein
LNKVLMQLTIVVMCGYFNILYNDMTKEIALIRRCTHSFVTLIETKYWKHISCKYCTKNKLLIKES